MNLPYPCAGQIIRRCTGMATKAHGGPTCRYRLSRSLANYGRPVRSRGSPTRLHQIVGAPRSSKTRLGYDEWAFEMATSEAASFAKKPAHIRRQIYSRVLGALYTLDGRRPLLRPQNRRCRWIAYHCRHVLRSPLVRAPSKESRDIARGVYRRPLALKRDFWLAIRTTSAPA